MSLISVWGNVENTLGLRDQGLLDSALAQPMVTFGGEWLHPTLVDQTAAYLYHFRFAHF
ncbi:hypothetical protein [Phormidium sp. FACHB-1136]|uniref:hypothetical protein n=1 Tax=Phormidium sp. FACHB-1136 TaxID=2692848 RepID=UPI001F54CC54|nr:hypothetical protein [Phormidium sp. FACHB-1136]